MKKILNKLKQKSDRIDWTESILSLIRDLIVGLILLLIDKLID